MIIKQRGLSILRAIIVGALVFFVSYIATALIISLYANVIAFKKQGAPDPIKLGYFMRIIILYISPILTIICIFLAGAILKKKYPSTTQFEGFWIALSALCFSEWVTMYYGVWKASAQTIIFILIACLAGIASSLFSDHPLFSRFGIKKVMLEKCVSELTSREKEITNELLKGKTNKQIADYLFIEEGTVKNHLKNIFKKIRVKNRVELITILRK